MSEHPDSAARARGAEPLLSAIQELKERIERAGWQHAPGSLTVVYVNDVIDWLDELAAQGEAAREPGLREPLVTLLDELRGALAAWDDKRYISAPLFLEERVWRAVRRLAESAPPRVPAPEQEEK